VQQGHKEDKERWGQQVLTVHKDLKVLKVVLDHKVSKETSEPQEHKEDKEQLDRQDSVVLKVPEDLKEV
jgi:hypothetical protein